MQVKRWLLESVPWKDRRNTADRRDMGRTVYRSDGIKKKILRKTGFVGKRDMGQLLHSAKKTDRILILFYGLRTKKYGRSLPEDHGKGIRCSISEPYGKLDRCEAKYKLLNRMAMVSGLENDPVMKREKEWSVQGLLYISTPLFKEAGIK